MIITIIYHLCLKHFNYSKVPQMVLNESGLNSEHVSLLKPICIAKHIALVLKQVVFIASVVLTFSGLNSEGGLNF